MEIPISNILLLCLIFLLIGGVIMILLQYLIFIKFSNLPDESEEQKRMNAKYTLPVNIKETARNLKAPPNPINSCENHQESLQGASALISLNFVMQFLFHEFKNSNRVRKWFYRKLSIELDELITKTTTGKLLDKLTIKELELGDQFPDIKSLSVHNVELDEREQRIENLDLLLDINYVGNFSTSIDADMVLGKKGSITLKVKQLSGMARLQFTRKPYTHWSLSFLGDPELILDIESKYQGRQMQSNITNLISNQIRKAVRRKHTLPNYKLRYKPFFHWTAEEEAVDCDIQPNGLLSVKVAELSRLMPWTSPGTGDTYCTITLAPVPFIEAHQKDHRHVLISLDVFIHKAKNQQIGIVFKQSTSQLVRIESVLPNTPACKSNLMAGDALVAIEGKQVTTIQQIAKVVKTLQATVFCLRIERVIPGIIRNDAILEDLEKYDELCDMPSASASASASASKTDTEAAEPTPTETGVPKHLVVKPSLSRQAAESGLTGQTPTNSPKKSNLIAKAIKKTMSRESSDKDKDKDKDKEKEREREREKEKDKDKDRDREKNKPDDSCTERYTDEPVNYFYQHSTIDCPFSALIHMDDVCSFQLDANSRFLNVCVFGKCAGESVLLGYNNVQIGQILVECSETSLNQCLRQIALNPASLQAGKMHDLANQSGFNPNLCFGDILFGFSWMGNPNVALGDPPTTKSGSKSHSPARTQFERGQDEPPSETVSLKSSSTLADSGISSAGSASAALPRAHSFVRTHFHRATQCDFCGKKIWLKDAMQCQECSMCCHKKCIAKCQNATVCGPVDCSGSVPPPLPQQTLTSTSTSTGAASTPSGVTRPEFTITQAENLELFEPGKTGTVPMEEAATMTGELGQAQVQMQMQAAGLDVHRSSLTGMLAQGIKRQASNLDIPGIVSSLTGSGQQMNSKSLPPSPQHTPSRKSSIVEEAPTAMGHQNPFERVTQQLEALPAECTVLSFEQVIIITEPIIRHTRNEDLMNLAKSSSKHLYASAPPDERVAKINGLLTKLKVALDAETEGYTMMNDAEKATESSPWKSASTLSVENRSDERVQALSIIMLYLCTGLQHAQGVVLQ
ncbi:LOW QUALITY PROTEIN: PDZ domain-containing protein 8 [Drosophila obscura]|uniref:LOW QUALITY PROTEIN: PDZ domain-containing protein 8 n=1 Tax=Drosophila obscura TaxID=7282 RepID=UPI001BB1E700|nr:LOW QUALITY PROTEIN: PDZ domain-containing protein 8 [Drosophila obscura]